MRGAAKKLADIEGFIAKWDYNKTYLKQLTQEELSEPTEKLLLTKMCPDDLSKYLTKEASRFSTSEQIRTEISDWVARVGYNAGQ